MADDMNIKDISSGLTRDKGLHAQAGVQVISHSSSFLQSHQGYRDETAVNESRKPEGRVLAVVHATRGAAGGNGKDPMTLREGPVSRPRSAGDPEDDDEEEEKKKSGDDDDDEEDDEEEEETWRV